MNEELKKIILTLEDHLEQMYDCFVNDETNLALFHMGAMQTLVTWLKEKNGLSAIQTTDKNSLREQLAPTLDGQAQETKETTGNGQIVCNRAGNRIVGSTVGGVVPNSSAETGRGQFTILDEIDSR